MRQTVIGILRDERGVLTLLEMLTVMAILAILIVALLPAQDAVINDAKVMATVEDLEILKKALLKFHADIGVWPARDDQLPNDGLSDVDLMGGACGGTGSTEGVITNDPGILCQGNTQGRVFVGPNTDGAFSTASAQFLARKWRGPYIRREIKSNPFGGSYILSFPTPGGSFISTRIPGLSAFCPPTATVCDSVAIQATRIPATAQIAIDRLLDDGNLSTGFVQGTSSTLTFLVAVF